MKHLMILMMTLLVPTTAIAKSACKDERIKFCKDIVTAKGDIIDCLKQHETELSEACKASLDARSKANKGPEKPQ
jgi:Cysteine rich repeat